MKCPVDGAFLHAAGRGGFNLAACTRCHGLWLTRETLKRVCASPARPEWIDDFAAQPPLLQPGWTRRRLCPGCNCQLAVRWLRGIEIDVCQKCQGVWLDAGELRQIVAISRKLAAVTSGAPAPVRSAVAGGRESRWYDGVDIPCDADLFVAIGNSLGDLASHGVDASHAVVEFLGEALSLLDW